MKFVAPTLSLAKICRITVLVCLPLYAFTAAAQEFSFTDIQGKVQRLVDYRGKWVLVNFRSSQCVPCEEETPELVALHNAHKDSDLVVIGVTLDATPIMKTKAAVAAFIARQQVSYPMIISSYTMSEMQVGAVEKLPTSYLYDPTGKQLILQEESLTRADVETYLTLKNESQQKAVAP